MTMNNQITFTGTVTQLIEETGISQKTGEPWRRQTVVIEETDVQYPQAIVAQLTRDTLDQVSKGQTITAHLSFGKTEYNGRFYNNIRLWRITPVTGQSAAPAAPQPVPQKVPQKAQQQATPVQAPIIPPATDDLPF